MTQPKPLVQARKIGELSVRAIQAGGQKLDGGAMFGVVPKPLWERKIPADERNRIQLGMRCLLIEHPAGLLLIDTGAGNKETPKFHDIYGIENEGDAGATALEKGIAEAGYAPSDVKLVINTHLHFDHAGGNTRLDSAGALQPSFPNARYFARAGEYDYARNANERTAASYFDRNYVPLVESGQMELTKSDQEIVAGISVMRTPGHTPHHTSILIESAGERALYLGDLCPTTSHLPLPWIMGYDVEPLVSLETKRAVFKRALSEEWLLIFEHDATTAWAKIGFDGKNYFAVSE